MLRQHPATNLEPSGLTRMLPDEVQRNRAASGTARMNLDKPEHLEAQSSVHIGEFGPTDRNFAARHSDPLRVLSDQDRNTGDTTTWSPKHDPLRPSALRTRSTR